MGEGIREAVASGIKREDIFVVTKVWATYNTRVELGLEKSLKNLGLDYVDLFLVHWPLLLNPEGNDDKFPKKPDGTRDIIKDYNHVDTWKQMEKLIGTGKTKAIGVCNVGFASNEDRMLAEMLTMRIVQQEVPGGASSGGHYCSGRQPD